jgi:hypothetical protein
MGGGQESGVLGPTDGSTPGDTGARNDGSGYADATGQIDATGEGDATPLESGAEGCSDLLGVGPPSQWVYADPSGNLQYKTSPAGDRILDFSFAGYMGGGVGLPDVPVAAMLDPTGADDTAAIQAALDAVSARALTNGVRGAVLLKPGTYQVGATLKIAVSGVVLRGSGSGTGGTIVKMGMSPHVFLAIAGSGTWKTSGPVATVTDAYVPSGATSFHVDSAAGFAVGDPVLLSRPVTAAWVHYVGMDTLVRNNAPQTWLSPGDASHTDRVISSIAGNEVTLDVPIPDSLDAQYVKPPGATLQKYSFAGRISQVGFEAMQVQGYQQAVTITTAQSALLQVDALVDGWVKDIVAIDLVNAIVLNPTTKRLTLDGVQLKHTVAPNGSSGYPMDFTMNGTQILVQRSSSIGDNTYTFGTLKLVTGPNVVLNSNASGVHNRMEPHMRWATALLADGVNGGEAINFYNRGTDGSGHGWAIGWGVVWNSTATNLDVEQAPGSFNWEIGCTGAQNARLPNPPGTFDSYGVPVAPKSLYLAQLCQRLGRQAVRNIGYP